MMKHGFAVNVQVSDSDLEIPEHLAIMLFQSVRELLLNAIKHAETGQATVSMGQHGDNCALKSGMTAKASILLLPRPLSGWLRNSAYSAFESG
jgi:hypothetical protein